MPNKQLQKTSFGSQPPTSPHPTKEIKNRDNSKSNTCGSTIARFRTPIDNPGNTNS